MGNCRISVQYFYGVFLGVVHFLYKNMTNSANYATHIAYCPHYPAVVPNVYICKKTMHNVYIMQVFYFRLPNFGGCEHQTCF